MRGHSCKQILKSSIYGKKNTCKTWDQIIDILQAIEGKANDLELSAHRLLAKPRQNSKYQIYNLVGHWLVFAKCSNETGGVSIFSLWIELYSLFATIVVQNLVYLTNILLFYSFFHLLVPNCSSMTTTTTRKQHHTLLLLLLF